MNSRAAELRKRVTKIVPTAKRDAQFLSSPSDVALESVAGIQGAPVLERNTHSPFPSFSIRAIRIGEIPERDCVLVSSCGIENR